MPPVDAAIADFELPQAGRALRASGHTSDAQRSEALGWMARVGTSIAPRIPRVGTTAAVTIGTLGSLAPGLLPRTPAAQGILTALLVVLALTVAGVVRVVVRRFRTAREKSVGMRGIAMAFGVGAAGVAMVRAQDWQNRLREAMGVASIGPGYWVRWMLVAAAIVAVVLAVWFGLRWAVRGLGRARSALLGLVAVLGVQFAGAPMVVEWRKEAYVAADSFVDPSVVQPVSPTRSGSPVSAASWANLGAQGRRFVAGDGGQGVRVYVGLNSAAGLAARVELAVRELERAGGFERGNIVLTVPTGSGWIDSDAAKGMNDRFGGDVALVGLQYSAAPSWVTFMFGRSAAEESARALFAAVEQRISRLPQRPKLYVYGQSLGALGGNSIFADDAEQDRRTCSVLWAGPPANAVHRSGAMVLANASDPVVHWSPSLLWHAPDLTGARPDAPLPQWLPVLSFVQATADLLGALDAPAGHGHRYGTDQGTALPDC
ncbi:alpha/beta-hydrolase family protein [Nocardia inohanensis]|uniref:alpha/beta-hydrolase family protein n=1 Tax=Nocardia inohanensis TaxID=209246 RepID=UPI001FE17E43|nr:alpha/beta-hydrolase family protein [Nocardia inohanensis]